MRHSYAHPAQQYHYPYSAYAVGILSDEELQAEIFKVIREQPTELKAAYVQLPILVNQYGLSKNALIPSFDHSLIKTPMTQTLTKKRRCNTSYHKWM